MVPGTVNTRRGVAVLWDTTKTSASRINRASFEHMMAEEANFTQSHQLKHVTFLDTMGEGVTSSTPHKYQQEMVLPSRPTKSHHPGKIGFQVAACKFRKMQEPRISKKDIHVHVEDRRLTQSEAIHLGKRLHCGPCLG